MFVNLDVLDFDLSWSPILTPLFQTFVTASVTCESEDVTDDCALSCCWAVHCQPSEVPSSFTKQGWLLSCFIHWQWHSPSAGCCRALYTDSDTLLQLAAVVLYTVTVTLSFSWLLSCFMHWQWHSPSAGCCRALCTDNDTLLQLAAVALYTVTVTVTLSFSWLLSRFMHWQWHSPSVILCILWFQMFVFD